MAQVRQKVRSLILSEFNRRVMIKTILMFFFLFGMMGTVEAGCYDTKITTNSETHVIRLLYVMEILYPELKRNEEYFIGYNRSTQEFCITGWQSAEPQPTQEQVTANLEAAYALQVAYKTRPDRITALWAIVNSEESTNIQFRRALIKLLKLKFRRGE